MRANSVNPDQTAPTGAVWSDSTLFVKKLLKDLRRWQEQTAFFVVGASGLSEVNLSKEAFLMDKL